MSRRVPPVEEHGPRQQGEKGVSRGSASPSSTESHAVGPSAPAPWDVQLGREQGARHDHLLEGPVALVDAGDDCSDVDFTGSLPMTGIAWAMIFDVKSSGSPKVLQVQLDVTTEHEIWGEVDTTLEGNVLSNGEPTLVSF